MGLLDKRAEAISKDFNSLELTLTLWAYDTMGRKLGERLMGLLTQPSVQKDVRDHGNIVQSMKREREREREIREVHTPLNFVNTLSGYETMESQPGERLMELLEERGVAISGEFEWQHFSDTLSAYTRMGRKPGERLMGLLDERMKAISGKLNCMNSQNISKLLLAYARVGKTFGKKRMMELLEGRMEAISGEFTPVHFLNTMMLAYSRMGRMPGERLMGLLEGRMEAISGELNSEVVSQVLWQYAKMAAKFGKKPGEPMMALLEKRAEAISGKFKSQAVSRTLRAYATMGRKPGERLMGLLEGRMETISGEFDSQDASDTLWAYTRMGRMPGERLTGLLEGRVEATAGEFEAISGEFDSQNVSDTLWAYATMKRKPPTGGTVDGAAGGADGDNIRGVLLTECFRHAVGVCGNGRKPGERLMVLLEERAEAISGEFNSQHFSRTLLAYATMERMPGERLVGLLERQAEAISGEFDLQDVSDTMWAYERMGRKLGERLMGLLKGRAEAISGKASEHHRVLQSVTRSPVDSREPGDVWSTPLFELPDAAVALSLAVCGAPGAPHRTSASFTAGK